MTRRWKHILFSLRGRYELAIIPYREKVEVKPVERWHRYLAVGLLIELSACSDPTVLKASGPTSVIRTGQYARFQSVYDTSMANPFESGMAGAMLSAGLGLIDNSCRDYFREQGRVQQVLPFVKDAGVLFAPVVAGTLAVSRTSAPELSYFAVGGAALTAGVSVTAMNFPFDADNIDAVETLTLNDMAAQEDQINNNAQQHPTQVNFDWVATQLEDHQLHCLPAHILLITRQAIAKGTITAFNGGGGGANGATAREITDLETKLARIVGATSITDARWWLCMA